MLLVLSNGGKLLQDLPHALLGQLRRLCGGSGRAGSGRAEQHSPVSGGALFLMLAAYWLCGSLMYVLMEAESQRWSAFEALYYVITCHATLGLGDYEPAQRAPPDRVRRCGGVPLAAYGLRAARHHRPGDPDHHHPG